MPGRRHRVLPGEPEPTAADYYEESPSLADPVHEAYSRNRIMGMSRAEAYRQAHGKTAVSSGDSSNAKRMEERHSEIGFRIMRLQELAARRTIESVTINKGYVMDTLHEVVERCMQRKPVLDKLGKETGEYQFKENAVVKACDTMANIMGWKKQPAPREGVEDMPDETIDRRISELANELAAEQREGAAPNASSGEGQEEAQPISAIPEAS